MSPSIQISVPEQGTEIELSKDEAINWLNKELQFFGEVGGLLSDSIVINNQNHGNPGIQQSATNELITALEALKKDDDKPLRNYLNEASRLRIVLGQGLIGDHVRQLMTQGRTEEAKHSLYFYCGKWTGSTIDRSLAPIRAAVLSGPGLMAAGSLEAAKISRIQSSQAQSVSRAAAEQLTNLLAEKKALFGSLEQLYREKLPIDEPAVFWADLASRKKREYYRWLSLFTFLCIVPLLLISYSPQKFIDAVVQITTNGGSGSPNNGNGISVAGLAAITVPALFYAWFLRMIGRLFVQSHTLSDDAMHRHALSRTYLGLVANPEHGMQKEDRAIILNALFRPIPPHNGDEGPPSGLIELIRGRPNS